MNLKPYKSANLCIKLQVKVIEWSSMLLFVINNYMTFIVILSNVLILSTNYTG